MPNLGTNCRKEGCGKPADGGKQYCRRHYAAWRRGTLPKPRTKSCRLDGCRKPLVARGRCEEHLARDFPGKKKAEAQTAAAATPVES